MPNVDKHAPGAFCWIELATTDQNAAKQFYGQLFGWSANDFPMGPDDTYTIFQLQGRDAAAGYTLRPDQKQHGVPPHWLPYVAVENADKAASRAAELGGRVIAGPFDVGESGRMAVVADPTGAVFAVWQAKGNQGIGIAGEEGTLCWVDLSTPDRDKAKQFYSSLFGWEIALGEHDNDPNGYLHIKNGDEFIGAIQSLHTRSANVPPHWLAYFYVRDCRAKADQAQKLGAQVHGGVMDIENVGLMAVVADPQGAVLSLFTESRQQ